MSAVSYVTPTSLSEDILDWDDLGGARLERLQQALIAAFPSYATLAELLEFGLARPLPVIASEGPLGHVVFQLLTTARAEGWLLQLYEAAIASKPGNKKLIGFAKGAPLRVIREQGGAQELIPLDAGALQKAVPGAPPPTDLDTMLTALADMRGRVCRVEIAGRAAGTGFLIGPATVLTNWHVVHQGGVPVNGSDIKLRFDYRRSQGQMVHEGTVFEVEADWLLDALPPSDRDSEEEPIAEPTLDELDYALLRVAGDPGKSRVGGDRTVPSAPERSWIKLPPGSPALSLGSPLYVLQHPLGEPLSIAHSTKAITSVHQNRTRVRYAVHTEAGSSGSPCFSKDWSLVALHHSGQPAVNPRWNEGIPIDTIRDRLIARGKWDVIGN